MYSRTYYQGDFVPGPSQPPRRLEPSTGTSYFVDPWSYGLRFLTPCEDGPPTVAERARAGRATAIGRGYSDVSTGSSVASSGSGSSAHYGAASGTGAGIGLVSSAAAFTPDSPLLHHGSPVDPEHVPAIKERRKILKKLRQISGLKQKLAEGSQLDAQQHHKLDTEYQLRESLQEKERVLVAAGITLSPASSSVEEYGHAMPPISI